MATFYAVNGKVYWGHQANWKQMGKKEYETLEEAIEFAKTLKGMEREVVKMTELDDKWDKEVVAIWKFDKIKKGVARIK